MCVFSFSCSPGRPRRVRQPMDELLIVVLFSALTGVMIGSLGTVVTFWFCGALECNTAIEQVSPEVEKSG